MTINEWIAYHLSFVQVIFFKWWITNRLQQNIIYYLYNIFVSVRSIWILNIRISETQEKGFESLQEQ